MSRWNGRCATLGMPKVFTSLLQLLHLWETCISYNQYQHLHFPPFSTQCNIIKAKQNTPLAHHLDPGVWIKMLMLPKLKGWTLGRATVFLVIRNSKVVSERWLPTLLLHLCLSSCPGVLITLISPTCSGSFSLPHLSLPFQRPAAFPLGITQALHKRRILFWMSCSLSQAPFPQMGWELFAVSISRCRFKIWNSLTFLISGYCT